MRRMAKHSQKHISGWPAFLLAPIAIPCIIIVIICQKAFGLKSTVDLTPLDVASYLEDWIEGKGGDWDWDDFTSIPITDPFLESVREEAAHMAYPLEEADVSRLRELLQEVRTLI